MWYQFFKYVFFVPVVTLVFHPWIKGRSNVPAEGGVILASNHLSAGDTFVLPTLMRRRMVFPAKAELFEGSGGLGSKLLAWFLKRAGMVPLDRSGGRSSAMGLQPVIDAVKSGRMVGIYPEGTRSPDGRLYKGRTGVARMVLEAGVPVVPVGMVRTQFVRSRIGLLTMDHPGVVVGEPMDFTHLAERRSELKVLRYVTDEIMAAIQQLSGQDYVDVYGSRVKDGELSEEQLAPYLGGVPGAGRELPPPAGDKATDHG